MPQISLKSPSASEPCSTPRNSCFACLGRAFFLGILFATLSSCGSGGSSGSQAGYTVGGTVSGLTGTGLVLQNNAGNNLTITGNGPFSFTAALANGANYTVTILSYPGAPTQTCTVSNGMGTIAAAAVTNVAVNCVVAKVPRFAYVANLSDNTVSAYTVDAGTGALNAVGTPVATGLTPLSLAVDPAGRFAYVANAGNTVSAYAINAATGALTSVGGSPFLAGLAPNSVVVDPTGKFVYVTNYDNNTVSIFTINAATGALTAAGTVMTGLNPHFVTVDPTGKFVYVANWSDNTISVYAINAATGVLALVGSPIATGINPYSIAVDRKSVV